MIVRFFFVLLLLGLGNVALGQSDTAIATLEAELEEVKARLEQLEKAITLLRGDRPPSSPIPIMQTSTSRSPTPTIRGGSGDVLVVRGEVEAPSYGARLHDHHDLSHARPAARQIRLGQ